MSEKNEWRSNLSEEELSKVTGGEKIVVVVYQCQKCGAPYIQSLNCGYPVPNCCGKPMKAVQTIITS